MTSDNCNLSILRAILFYYLDSMLPPLLFLWLLHFLERFKTPWNNRGNHFGAFVKGEMSLSNILLQLIEQKRLARAWKSVQPDNNWFSI